MAKVRVLPEEARYDYYDVYLPPDLHDGTDKMYWEDMCQSAIRQAEARIRLYAIPCLWTVTQIVEDARFEEIHFRVRRKRPF